MVHRHTVHLPLGALLIWCTMCGTGRTTSPLPLPHLPHRYCAERVSDESSSERVHLSPDTEVGCDLRSVICDLRSAICDL